MEQILDSMESMAHSVTEVAENATSLAMTVANLTESERGVEANMNELVEKAGVGRRDMSKVSDGMQDIVASMNDMNTAVNEISRAIETTGAISQEQAASTERHEYRCTLRRSGG